MLPTEVPKEEEEEEEEVQPVHLPSKNKTVDIAITTSTSPKETSSSGRRRVQRFLKSPRMAHKDGGCWGDGGEDDEGVAEINIGDIYYFGDDDDGGGKVEQDHVKALE